LAVDRRNRWSAGPSSGPSPLASESVPFQSFGFLGRQRLGPLGGSRSPSQPNRSQRSSPRVQQPKRHRDGAAFALPLALVAGLVLSASSLSLLGLALASHQVQAADHQRRQADDGLSDLAQLLAHQLVGHRPEELNPANLGPDRLAMALPAGWQLGRLQWQPSEPADPGLVTLQVTLSALGGEQRQGLVHFDRSLANGLIRSLHQEGA